MMMMKLLFACCLIATLPRSSWCSDAFALPSQSTAPREECCLSSSSLPPHPLPKIVNPLTNRLITLGGKTYNNLLSQGRFVQHNGTLYPIDFDELRSKSIPEQSNDDTITPWNPTATNDEWFILTPQLVTDNSNSDHFNPPKELLFVHKPSGLHCVPPRDLSQPSLVQQVMSKYPTAKPCHRLDFDTSGIVLFGLTAEAHTVISKQFEDRTTKKTYLALVSGLPPQDEGTVDLEIGKIKTPQGFNRWACPHPTSQELINPRPAVTHYRILKRFQDNDFSLVELFPRTGRGHQLRLHMKSIGHSILGDTLHAPSSHIADCSPRLCLHAQRLEVEWDGSRICAESIPPF